MTNCKFIILILWLFSAPLMGKDIIWFNGHNHVSYDFHGKKSSVVEIALDMFSNDMFNITGVEAVRSQGAPIEIFELDKLKDKEFKKLSKRRIPLDKIITKKDAFYLGTEGGKIVIVGSNDFGTAYGILELSRIAGVSVWTWWNDVPPQKKKYLGIPEEYYTIQWPSVERRGFKVNENHFEQRRQFELLLRLRGNTLNATRGDGTKHLDINEKWLPGTQPGYIFAEMKGAYNHGATQDWIANIRNPKVVAYQLQLFMDMAWNTNYVTYDNIQEHYKKWLCEQFGEQIGQELLPIMTKYYHLSGIRKAELMDVEFAADAFGNELERYITNFNNLCKSVKKVSADVPDNLKDAFFSVVEYPVYAAAAMAEKQLQAQEARHIARPQSFHNDEEALYSAVRSWKAYEELNRLTAFYNNKLAKGKWKNKLDIAHDKLINGEPQLPDRITKKEIERYGNPEPIEFNLDTYNTITRNACEYRKATSGCHPIEMLGHSMKAMFVPKGELLSYSFYSELKGEALIRIAAIPTQGYETSDIRISVRIDKGQPKIFSIKLDPRSLEWKTVKDRGQIICEISQHLSQNCHDIEIKALDDFVIIDQIMVDYDPDRTFYMFPVASALY